MATMTPTLSATSAAESTVDSSVDSTPRRRRTTWWLAANSVVAVAALGVGASALSHDDSARVIRYYVPVSSSTAHASDQPVCSRIALSRC